MFDMYVPNKRTRCMRQLLIQLPGELEKSFFVLRDFNSFLFVTNRTSKQKIRNRVDLNSIIIQLVLIDT